MRELTGEEKRAKRNEKGNEKANTNLARRGPRTQSGETGENLFKHVGRCSGTFTMLVWATNTMLNKSGDNPAQGRIGHNGMKAKP